MLTRVDRLQLHQTLELDTSCRHYTITRGNYEFNSRRPTTKPLIILKVTKPLIISKVESV